MLVALLLISVVVSGSREYATLGCESPGECIQSTKPGLQPSDIELVEDYLYSLGAACEIRWKDRHTYKACLKDSLRDIIDGEGELTALAEAGMQSWIEYMTDEYVRRVQ
jgi:hypothetical protein